jgi:hypothetical protein
MSTLFWILGIAFVVSLAPLAVLLACRYLSFRSGREVVCPNTFAVEKVNVDAGHAAWTAVTGDPEFKLTACTGSAHKAGCNESCLVQLEAPAVSTASQSGEPAAQISRLVG